MISVHVTWKNTLQNNKPELFAKNIEESVIFLYNYYTPYFSIQLVTEGSYDYLSGCKA